MQRLTGLDASFLYNETPTLHMHTLKIAVLDPSPWESAPSHELIRDEVGRRLHLLPPFRRRLVDVPFGLHHPLWIEDPDFDLDHHVRRVPVDAPGDRRQMDETIARLASTPLDRDRPLWQLYVLDGLADGRIGVLIKIHHALADGAAAAQLLMNVMSLGATDDADGVAAAWQPERVPGRLRLVRDAVADAMANLRELPRLLVDTLRRLRPALRVRREADVAPPRPLLDAPRTSFNGALTADRCFATTRLSLSDAKAVRRAHGVTVNDVVLALAGGALRSYLEDRGESPDRSLIAGVPVSTDEPTGVARLGGNKVSNLFTTIGSSIADPVERLHAIHEVTGTAKQMQNLLGATLMQDWIEYTPPRPYAWFIRQYSRLRVADHHPPPINLVVSNVPGPREPLYAAGARLVELYSVGPILEGVGLNITVWSYLDDLNVGVLACPAAVPDPHQITDRLEEAMRELLATVDEPTAVRS